MVAKIERLPDHIINKLKAGEIVERPASVVKELIENALDAGADSILIEIEDGGKKLIKIEDNGTGIGREDLSLVCERYTTSKIRTESDFYSISTYGFRGEALATISEVSQFSLLTKTHGDRTGVLLQKVGDEITISEKPVPYFHGTTILVENLFYNIPVRQKFIKSKQTEYYYIYELFVDYALLHQDKQRTLKKDGKIVLQCKKTDGILGRIEQLHNPSWLQNIVPVDFEHDGWNVWGCISDASLQFGSQEHLKIYVNNRPVQDKIIKKAILQAYERQMHYGNFPLAYIFLTVPPHTLDVNVHPRKMEVRFLDSGSVFQFIFQAIQNALGNNKMSSATLSPQNSFQDLSTSISSGISVDQGSLLGAAYSGMATQSMMFEASQESVQVHGMSIVGQLWNLYICLEDAENMYLVDQHALAERINFEKLRKIYQPGKGPQPLLTPIAIPISMGMSEDRIDELTALDFDVSKIADNTLGIYGVPDFFLTHQIDLQKVLMHALYQEKVDVQSILDSILATKACKISIKAGEKLSSQEMKQLINDGFETIEQMFVCQHGRPFFLSFKRSQIDGMFDR